MTKSSKRNSRNLDDESYNPDMTVAEANNSDRLPEGPTKAYDPSMTESQAIEIVKRLKREGRLPSPEEIEEGLQKLLADFS